MMCDYEKKLRKEKILKVISQLVIISHFKILEISKIVIYNKDSKHFQKPKILISQSSLKYVKLM